MSGVDIFCDKMGLGNGANTRICAQILLLLLTAPVQWHDHNTIQAILIGMTAQFSSEVEVCNTLLICVDMLSIDQDLASWKWETSIPHALEHGFWSKDYISKLVSVQDMSRHIFTSFYSFYTLVYFLMAQHISFATWPMNVRPLRKWDSGHHCRGSPPTITSIARYNTCRHKK